MMARCPSLSERISEPHVQQGLVRKRRAEERCKERTLSTTGPWPALTPSRCLATLPMTEVWPSVFAIRLPWPARLQPEAHVADGAQKRIWCEPPQVDNGALERPIMSPTNAAWPR